MLANGPTPAEPSFSSMGKISSKPQNAAFGHHHPRYDPLKLGPYICKKLGYDMAQIRLYTGGTERVSGTHPEARKRDPPPP